MQLLRHTARRRHAFSASFIARRRRTSGAFLLEALVAIIVFAVGTLALLELIAGAVRESGNARWRDEASTLAASALSRMWSDDPATLDVRYDATTGRTTVDWGFALLLIPIAAAGIGTPVIFAAAARVRGKE